jgi:hypothetical protein
MLATKLSTAIQMVAVSVSEANGSSEIQFF